jgi:8-oxo-dGTP pyrophosphatase MutT (NUDIX family)
MEVPESLERVIEESYGCIPVHKREDGELLFGLVEQPDNYFNFPKGHAYPGESVEQTIRRELAEETSITEVDLQMDTEFSEKYAYVRGNKMFDKTVKFFVGYTTQLTTRPAQGFEDEVVKVHWLTKDEVLEKLTYDASKKIFEGVCKHLGV